MSRIILLLLGMLGAAACGIGEEIETQFKGQKIEQVETPDLICAVARYSRAISIDCVRKDDDGPG